MSDRKPFAPTFARSHDEPEPNAVSYGRIVDAGGPVGKPQHTASGLARVQQIGGTDGFADLPDAAEPDAAEPVEVADALAVDLDSRP